MRQDRDRVHPGGTGVVDTRTGRMVVECADDPFRPGLEEVTAPVLAGLLNAPAPVPADGTGRHVVERRDDWEGGEEHVLVDTAPRRPRQICFTPVMEGAPPPADASLKLLLRLAVALDREPLAWTGWKTPTEHRITIRGHHRDLLPEHGDRLAGHHLFGR